MSPYSRSAKVLMYLTISMTAATGLLLWMEHLVIPPNTQPGQTTILNPLSEVVRTAKTIQPGAWEEIVISYRDRLPSVAAAVAMAAPTQRLPYHFVIDAEGQINPLSAWQEQKADVSGTEVVTRAIHVCLAGQGEGGGVPAEQWDALIGLLRQLRTQCQLPTNAVRLDPQSDPEIRPNVPPPAHRLRQMLLEAQVIN